MNNKTKKMVTTGVLIALAAVLSWIKVYELPYGGSITLFSMVPAVVLGYKYGIKWGLASGVINGVLQTIFGASTQAFAGMYDSEHALLSIFKIVLMASLDYIVAFAVLGLAGMFKGKIKNDTAAFTAGSVVAVTLRFITHFLSGWILWGSYAEWYFTETMNNSFGQSVLQNVSGQALAVVYSLVYNASYMVPELIITIVGVLAIMAVKPLRKIIVDENA